MRQTLLLSATALGLSVGGLWLVGPAVAQTTSGTGYSAGYNAPSTHAPVSAQASNIASADVRSRIAPPLPTPPGAHNASPRELLGMAQNALRRGRTGEAQQALEMAMTGELNDPAMAGSPQNNPMVGQINSALQALGQNDHAGAMQAIQTAMSSPGAGMGEPGPGQAGMNEPGMGAPGMGHPGMAGAGMPAQGAAPAPPR